MSNKNFSQENLEDMLSNFIDDLNDDIKPDYDAIHEAEDDELLEMLQTVCAVKRLREDEEFKVVNIEDVKRKERKDMKRKNSFFKKLVATAAMAAVLVGGGMVYQNTNNVKNAKNIAYAMIKNYENIDSFRGVLEQKLINKDSETSSTIDIQYAEPNKFYAVHHLENGKTTSKLYNGGDTLYEYDENNKLTMTTATEDTIEFHLSSYRTDKKLKERLEGLKNAKLIGEEIVAGRNTEVYELKYVENAKLIHKVWVDKEVGIALKEYFEDENGAKITSEFIKFENNVEIELPTISDKDEDNAVDERLTEEEMEKEEELKEIKEGFKDGQKVDVEFVGLADSNSAEFKVGENYFVFGITESLKEKFSNMGSMTKLNVTLGFEEWTTNPIVKEIN